MASFEATMKKFLEDYEKQTEDVLVKEFMTLKSQSQKYKESNRYPAEAGQLAINKRKNRFKDILPFEYTRVELHPVEGVEGSDYVNANYILGFDGEINYIAAQGPLPNTVPDFWRMIWYHNIEIVVMACREVEMGKNKCERYWPQVGHSMEIGAIQVTTTFEENVSNDFVIRDFAAECQGEKQVIRQYHYNAWPDHGKPDSPDPIIRMIELIENYRKHTDIPIVVHCSAGCGRTGTLIGIDVAKALLLSKDVPPDFSVFKIVEKMRQQRPAMVQAKDQYLFVYMAIAELARRSIGINPTLPPKPVNKPVPYTGKSYMNLDTNTPEAVRSRSPTPSARSHSSSPPLLPVPDSSTTNNSHSSSNGPLYENVDNQPPLPTRKRHETTSDPLPETPDEKSKPISKPKPRPKPGPPPPEKPHKEDAIAMTTAQLSALPKPRKEDAPTAALPKPRKEDAPTAQPPALPKPRKEDTLTVQPVVVPKPRPRKTAKSDNEGADTTSPPLPSSSAPMGLAVQQQLRKTTPPDVANRNSLRADTPERVMRPKSPDMSKRPLPLAPGETPSSSSSSSPQKSPGHRTPRRMSRESTPVDITSTYSLMGAADEELTTPMKAADKSSSSIMDTFKDILGEELMQVVDKKKPATPAPMPISTRPLPSVPPTSSSFDRRESMEGPPPAIPQRTDASLELIEPVTTSSVVAPTYDVPGDITSSGMERNRSPFPPVVEVDDYEEAAPFVLPMGGKKTTPPLPASPCPAPSLSPASSTGSSASSTFNRGSSTHSRGGKIGRFFKSKKDTKKKGLDDDSIGLPPSSATMPVRSSSRPASSPTISVEEKYKFPGRMGFGIRLERPTGPREEPHHWKHISMPEAIHVP